MPDVEDEAGQSFRCKSCRAKIYFLKNRKSGNTIPVQKVTTLYAIQPQLVGEPELVTIERKSPKFVYISHFQVCPDADQFSRRFS